MPWSACQASRAGSLGFCTVWRWKLRLARSLPPILTVQLSSGFGWCWTSGIEDGPRDGWLQLFLPSSFGIHPKSGSLACRVELLSNRMGFTYSGLSAHKFVSRHVLFF